MPRIWMLLWSAIAVALLWKWAEVAPDRAALREPSGVTSLQQDFAKLLQRGSANANDKLTHPPLTQSFVTGDYRFVVTATDQWQTPEAMGQLYQGDDLLWEKSLSQQYGPRFVVVGSQGQVLLIDEFVNVASPYALMLVDVAGESVVTYSFDDVQQALSVSAAELTQQSTSGWWVSAVPQLAQGEVAPFDEDRLEENVLISAGGTRLAVNLLTGELTPDRDL